MNSAVKMQFAKIIAVLSANAAKRYYFLILRVCSKRVFLTKIKVCPISAVLKLLQYINRRNSFEFFKKHRFPTSAVTSKVTNKGQK